ncbi:glycosyltransferase [Actinokineospora auranticolor]|uniref:MGT family glycosyltransferase n=1 Tax=Actinokineospora auranticolor TaxID=155976 RepID=A0A2S6GTH3_9PSEU|nr:macrolide family glycosyltransferase [Actinokineospora auranticolor]PPK68483.1 MGT family glycosyltransferase [Actinokineospora auranticolor]
MAPHLLFVLYPAYGHTLPMVPIIDRLTRRGFLVTATTGAAMADRVRAAGARPVTYTTPLSTSAPPDVLEPDELAARTLRYLDESLAIAPVLDAACPAPPDAVVFDTTLWAPSRVAAARWGRPAVQVVPTFASNEHFSVTDKLSELSTPLDPAHPALVRFGERLAEHATAAGVSPAVYAGAGEANVVTIPREFQIRGETFGDDHVFVGPCLDPAPGTWTPPADGRRVVLVSLGTTVNARPDFFRDCVRAFAGSDWHLVLSLGGRVTPEELGPLPPGVEAHDWIPHGDVLAHASVFVCQSGMGSVQEALHHGVPLVVAPHHPEQRANADRIAELGLGEVLHRHTVTGDLVLAATTAVAADAALRARVLRMRDHIRAAGGADRAADAIAAHVSTRV